MCACIYIHLRRHACVNLHMKIYLHAVHTRVYLCMYAACMDLCYSACVFVSMHSCKLAGVYFAAVVLTARSCWLSARGSALPLEVAWAAHASSVAWSSLPHFEVTGEQRVHGREAAAGRVPGASSTLSAARQLVPLSVCLAFTLPFAHTSSWASCGAQEWVLAGCWQAAEDKHGTAKSLVLRSQARVTATAREGVLCKAPHDGM